MTEFVIWVNGTAYYVEAESFYEACSKLRDELNNN